MVSACSRLRQFSRGLIRLLILALLLSPARLSAGPQLQAADEPTFTINRRAVDVTLELGTSLELGLRITNITDRPRAVRMLIGSADVSEPTAVMPRRPALLPLPRQADRLARELAQLPPLTVREYIVYLTERPDLAPAAALDNWQQRGTDVYTLLTSTAARSQADLQALLRARGVAFRELWVANALAVRGTVELAAELSRRSDVALVSANHVVQQPPLPVTARAASGCAPTADNVCWNVAAIGAQRVWQELGARGAGITVATIDSGANYLHPALRTAYRGHNSDGSYQHDYAWFDAAGSALVPTDNAGHGTHVLGTMVGAVSGRPAFGVAPDARWIAARACLESCSEIDLIAAAQWMLAPTRVDGTQPRPDLRPHVINNSWAYDSGGETFYDGYLAAWRAAGIYPVFAAGNLSPLTYPSGNLSGCGTIASPGDSGLVTAVGAVDSDGRLATFSRVGPSLNGLLKPDLSAPGDGVSSSVGSNSYLTLSGTSMASPHVAATVALLWSANPALIGRLDRTYDLLTRGAQPVTDDARYAAAAHRACPIDEHPNNLYGYGRLDAYGAALRAVPSREWLQFNPWMWPLAPGESNWTSLVLNAAAVPAAGVYEATLLIYPVDYSGTPLTLPIRLTVPSRAGHVSLSGSVLDGTTGTPLQGVVRTSGGARVLTDATGRYSLQLTPATTHVLTATAQGYAAAAVNFSAPAGVEETRDIPLALLRSVLTATPTQITLTQALTMVTTATLVLSSTGTAPVSYALSREYEPYGVWRSDEATLSAVGWIAPPADRQILTLSDDGVSAGITMPFTVTLGSYRSRTLRVSANGVVAFGRMSHAYHSPGCLPLPETIGPAIAVLRTDLNPSLGGEVSVATLPDGVLVSWSDVPLFRAEGSPERRISAQILIRPDSNFVLHFGNVSALAAADDVAVGLQDEQRISQRIICNSSWPSAALLSDGLQIELRRQASSDQWLRWSAERGTLAAQSLTAITLRPLRLAGFSGDLRARLLVTSSDDVQPLRHIVVTVAQPAAPYQYLLTDIRR